MEPKIIILKPNNVCKISDCNFKKDCNGLKEKRETEFICDLDKLKKIYKVKNIDSLIKNKKKR